MKRIVILLLAVLAAFGFFACTDSLNPSRDAKAGGSLAVKATFADPAAGASLNESASLNENATYYSAEKFSSGKIIVERGEQKITKAMNISGTTASASISGLAEGTWSLTVIFYDSEGDITFQGSTNVEIIPGEITIANVVLTGEGSLEITIELPILPEGLILWNKLGSQAEVENSEKGPSGFFDNPEGELSFEPGKFGNGVRYKFYPTDGKNRSKIAFDMTEVNFTIEKGTIEFWWEAGYENGLYTGNHGYRSFFNTANSLEHPPRPSTPNGNPLIAFRNDNFTASRPEISFSIGLNTQGKVVTEGTSPTYNAFDLGERMHWAIAYDVSGIGDTGKTIMFFKNGVEIFSSSSTWETGKIDYFWLGVLGDTYFGRDVRELGYASASGVYDNLKIWDHAKTSFDLTKE